MLSALDSVWTRDQPWSSLPVPAGSLQWSLLTVTRSSLFIWLPLCLQSFSPLPDIDSLPPKQNSLSSRAQMPVVIHPEFLSNIPPCRILLMQGSASTADGALCFIFLFFFYVQPQCDICSPPPPHCWTNALWVQTTVAYAVHDILVLRVQSHWC